MKVPTSDSSFTPTTELANGSPKTIYLFFLLNLCSRYFDTMKDASSNDVNIDAATASLLAFCPDKGTRERLLNEYMNEKKKSGSNITTASVITVGDLISYLSETMEFTETATGGFG